MPEKAQERMAERPPLEARPPERTPGGAEELPTRKGGYDRLAAEAGRAAEAPAQAAATAQEELGRSMTALMQETTRSLRSVMAMPAMPTPGVIELQEAMAEFVTGLVRNHLRFMQEAMRIYSPQEHAALLDKLMRQWLDSAIAGQSALLRLAQPGSAEAPKPLEALAARQGATTH